MMWYFVLPLSMVRSMQKSSRSLEGSESSTPSRGNASLQVALGKRIRKHREQRGVAQETFAYEAGFNRAWYGSVERGRYNITASNLARIALALGVEVGELFPSKAELATLFIGVPDDSAT